MPAAIEMTNRQHVAAGVDILDQDGQPITEVPGSLTVQFETSDPAVAGIIVQPNGLDIDVTSGNVGNAVVTVTVTGLPAGTLTDTLSVAVKNSAPNSANFRVGVPVDES